ncbi:hypothetical protein [Streptomyces sp. NPDC059783]|uniref:hypothetical protein n=1 Tax=Streptomyces sp. NPDC059783 TaxID=3346944 RepID=UPI00366728B5
MTAAALAVAAAAGVIAAACLRPCAHRFGTGAVLATLLVCAVAGALGCRFAARLAAPRLTGALAAALLGLGTALAVPGPPAAAGTAAAVLVAGVPATVFATGCLLRVLAPSARRACVLAGPALAAGGALGALWPPQARAAAGACLCAVALLLVLPTVTTPPDRTTDQGARP